MARVCLRRLGLGVLVWGLAGQALAAPPFGDTAGTVFDIITDTDPSAFVCLDPQGQGARQIWDKRVDGEPVVQAHLFAARYADGATIEIRVNPEFDAATARALADRFARPLGRLPGSLRAGIAAFSIHGGDQSFHAGTGQIVVYTARADQRASYAHLEESLFHEAVHASWDEDHRLAPGWRAAQAADGGFLTQYGADSPDREDLAETALFAFALLHHPDRLPPADTADTRRAVPNRIAYVAGLLPPGVPLTVAARGRPTCAAGG
ncbi:MAG: hypothetical protein V4712_00215 [Pseudomonadota bacterium]